MNISFFLKPKLDVSYLYDDSPVSQALNDILNSNFTAIPLIDRQGRYTGTICEGDFLRLLMQNRPEEVGQWAVGRVPRRFIHHTVNIDAAMEDMAELVTEQNFVPVVDGRGMFIGIITRHDVLNYLQGLMPNSHHSKSTVFHCETCINTP